MPRPRLSLVAVFTFFLVIACVVVARERHQARRAAQQDEEEERRVKALPPVMPLPEKRKRALTPPPSARALERERSRRVRSQWRSPLFATLPFEIRAMVYEHVLAREVLHIAGRVAQVQVRRKEGDGLQEYLRLSNVRCIGRCHATCCNGRNYNVKCWECCGLDGDRRRRRMEGGRSKVGFLQSCRRM